MPLGYVPLPAYRPGGLIDFGPLNEGLDALGKTIRENRLMEQMKTIGDALQSGTSSSQGGNVNPLLSSSAAQYAPSSPSPTPAPSPASGAAAAAGRSSTPTATGGVCHASFIKDGSFTPNAMGSTAILMGYGPVKHEAGDTT